MQENEAGPLLHIIHKNWLETYHRSDGDLWGKSVRKFKGGGEGKWGWEKEINSLLSALRKQKSEVNCSIATIL